MLKFFLEKPNAMFEKKLTSWSRVHAYGEDGN